MKHYLDRKNSTCKTHYSRNPNIRKKLQEVRKAYELIPMLFHHAFLAT